MEGSPSKPKTNKKLMHLLGVDQHVISTNDHLVSLRAQAFSKQKEEEELRKTFEELLYLNKWEYFERDDEKNIVFMEGKNGRSDIKGATVKKLIEKLTSFDDVDSDFLTDFLVTYKTFTNTTSFLSLLSERFRMTLPDDFALDEKQTDFVNNVYFYTIRLRVLLLLKKWLEDFSDEISGDTFIINYLDEFLERDLRSSSFDSLSTSIAKLLCKVKKGEEVKKILLLPNEAPVSIAPDIKLLTQSHSSLQVLAFNSEELARQLTLLEFDIYKNIKISEFYKNAWMSKEKDKLAPNILKLIHRFNKVSQYVKLTIVQVEDVNKRVDILEKWIEVAHCLKSINNYNCIVSVMAGLNSVPVHRLKKTWSILSSNSLKLYSELNSIVVPDSNYQQLKSILRNLDASFPILPYLGMYLTDLVFIEDGYPSLLQDDLIHFEKRRKVAMVIKEVRQFQQIGYNFVPVPLIFGALLAGGEAYDENNCYQLSLTIEPKDPNERKLRHKRLNSNDELRNSDDSAKFLSRSLSMQSFSNAITKIKASASGGLGVSNTTTTTTTTNGTSETSPSSIKKKSLATQSETNLLQYLPKSTSKERKSLFKSMSYEVKTKPDFMEESPPSSGNSPIDEVYLYVPEELEETLEESQQLLQNYYKSENPEIKVDKVHGQITINGERHLLIRIGSLSAELITTIHQHNRYEDPLTIHNLLFDFMFINGKYDAKLFFTKIDLVQYSLLHQVISGFLFMSFKGLCNPLLREVKNINDPLKFWVTFECNYTPPSQSFLRNIGKQTQSSCTIIGSYISGWIDVCLTHETNISYLEVKCRSKGDAKCVFVVASLSVLENLIEEDNSVVYITKSMKKHIHNYSTGLDVYFKRYEDFESQVNSGKVKLPSKVPSKKSMKKPSAGALDDVVEMAKYESSLYHSLFKELKNEEGDIHYNGDLDKHYSSMLLLRCKSLVSEFGRLEIPHLFGSKDSSLLNRFSTNLLFELLSYVGYSDYNCFTKSQSNRDLNPIHKILGLKTFLSGLGFGSMKPSIESLKMNKKGTKFYMEFEVANSFESNTRGNTGKPVCAMLCGYATGWIRNMLNIPNIVVGETICKSTGLDCCHFVVSINTLLHSDIEHWLSQNNLKTFAAVSLAHLNTYLHRQSTLVKNDM